MSKRPLDEDFLPKTRCSKKLCPSDEQLKDYPMLDEVIFDWVDEKLFRCKRCQERQAAFDAISNKNKKMKEIRITEKGKLAELLQYNLESTHLGSDDLEQMVRTIHKKMESSEIDEDEYMGLFNQTLADLILTKYEAVIITSDEQVYGRNGKVDELLYDGTDTKIFLDAH